VHFDRLPLDGHDPMGRLIPFRRLRIKLLIRMLVVGYCYGIRSERKLCEEVEFRLAYRWFCRLDLDAQVSLDVLGQSSRPLSRL
jgi:transposase